MKTALRYLMVIALLSFSIQKTKAQCRATDILVQNLVPASSQTPGTCTATFDLSFTMEDNNGNKFIYLHGWAQSNYVNYFNCVNGDPSSNGVIQAPLQPDLVNAFLNLGIDNNDSIPVLLSTYTPDPSVSLNSVNSITRTVLPDGSAFFVLHGINATFPADCGTPFLMVVDFWSSQAAQAQVAHCVNCGLTYALNFLTVGGLANCATLMYNATITNQQSTALSGTYTVYADVNGDGFFSSAADPLIRNTTNFSLAAGAGSTTPISGSIPSVNINQDLLVITNLSIGGTDIFLVHSTLCAPLPVTFTSFTATRTSRTNVLLRWETATEINNSGFAILRNTGDNNWQLVDFIPTQALGGNSSSVLTYTYNDVNSTRGMTQYRIRQIDIDGKSKYSEIRSVRGEGQKGKTIIYPNPSFTGSVNVVFENSEGTRDVELTDMNGRMIKQWKAVPGNTIQINNLVQGMYSLRIFIRESGEQSVEKIVVNKN